MVSTERDGLEATVSSTPNGVIGKGFIYYSPCCPTGIRLLIGHQTIKQKTILVLLVQFDPQILNKREVNLPRLSKTQIGLGPVDLS